MSMLAVMVVLTVFGYMLGTAAYEVMMGAEVSDTTKQEIADTLQLAR